MSNPSKVKALRELREADAKAAEKRAKEKKSAPLSESERVTLGDLEQNIERGMQTFVLVGASLAQIREKRLYRANYASFEEYVEGRWGFTVARARQLIGASAVVEEVGDNRSVIPERHARELIPVPEGERAEAYQEAKESAESEGREATAEDVRKARAKRAPIHQRKKRKKHPQQKEQDNGPEERTGLPEGATEPGVGEQLPTGVEVAREEGAGHPEKVGSRGDGGARDSGEAELTEPGESAQQGGRHAMGVADSTAGSPDSVAAALYEAFEAGWFDNNGSISDAWAERFPDIMASEPVRRLIAEYEREEAA